MNFPHISTIESLEHYAVLIENYTDSYDFILKNKQLELSIRSFLAEQIDLKKKAHKKHPYFCEKKCFFMTKSIEQSTSDVVARAKSEYINLREGATVCDLTGGMGSETLQFSERANEMYYIEPNEFLFKLTKYNLSQFGISNKIHFQQTDAESFLDKFDGKADLMLLDPDRRSEEKREFLPENLSPNPIEIEEIALNKTGILWIKHSPLIDISYLRTHFEKLKSVQIISHKNEVKEVCSLHSKQELPLSEISVILIDAIGASKVFNFEFEDQNAAPKNFSLTRKYLYEPDKALIKSGCSDKFALKIDILPISPISPYYTSEELIENFPGKTVKVLFDEEFSASRFKIFLKRERLKKASISARNFILKANEIEEKFKLIPDNENMLFFYKNELGQNRFVFGKKS